MVYDFRFTTIVPGTKWSGILDFGFFVALSVHGAIISFLAVIKIVGDVDGRGDI